MKSLPGWVEAEFAGIESRNASALLVDRFRCPADVGSFLVGEPSSGDSGYFRFGSDAICYGQCSFEPRPGLLPDALQDALDFITTSGSTVRIPFDPYQIVDNLRLERYRATSRAWNALSLSYYAVRRVLPLWLRKPVQKLYLQDWDKISFPRWPVDQTVESIIDQLLVLSMKSGKIEKVPFIWFWPDGAGSCAIVTHDVETKRGLDLCHQLMDLDDSYGVKSSFQLVPQGRYVVSPRFLDKLRDRGFEINIHDLNHDGLLFRDKTEFLRRADRINYYGREFGALGFRAAVLYRNADWYDALKFAYDMSIPNVAHLDPQRGGCCTVFPFFIGNVLELPVTTTQDYSLFEILGDYSTRLWEDQMRLIRSRHGLMNFVIHPDYIAEQRRRDLYSDLLRVLDDLRSDRQVWLVTPGEAAAWWRTRSRLSLIQKDGAWQITGEGKQRARLAYATLDGESLSYVIQPQS